MYRGLCGGGVCGLVWCGMFCGERGKGQVERRSFGGNWLVDCEWMSTRVIADLLLFVYICEFLRHCLTHRHRYDINLDDH